MTKTIILTGGGSAGHVTPNLALLPRLKAEGFTVHYIGTADGIEKSLVEGREDVTYHAISAGKLRRYFSLKNFTDPFRVVKGMFQARRIIKEVKPDVVFSKGGFVTVPVVMAAKGKAPIVAHESDYSPGLANKITAKFADRICVTFEDTLRQVGSKGVFTGTPIRPELYEGDAKRGLKFAGFSGEKPVLLMMGGSQGALAINNALRAALPKLGRTFDIIHLCGKGKLDQSIEDPCYRQYEYISGELPDLLAAADVILSRAGANAVFEFLALAKPALLIPLPLSASRGDQLLNAGYFSRKGYAMTLEQEQMTPDTLFDAINDLYDRRLSFISAMSSDAMADGTDEVLSVIRELTERK
ncbi:MAG: undecaprenyldiphospho-muramoylpentapeptide beta-N-acetylglucosaminyltransferase [Clostridia bacterium]|nr:undecaprenyldiphospho-muramoylpentapeptide beta-N-acetylglucosaminyltransferase [Clostridia bacterium]